MNKEKYYQLNMLVRQLEQLTNTLYQESKWIPVTNRYPKVGEIVLCQCRANICEVLKMTDNGWYCNISHKYFYYSYVVAWQPLPKPYIEEGEKSNE